MSPADYDYIIVGAGSAGCVLADRLSEDPANRVLLLEAGPPDRNPLITIPKGVARVMKDPSLTWSYRTEARGHDGSPETWVRGKVVGGTSSINGMVYGRGHPEDYDEWDRDGAHGWSWGEIEPCLEQIERRIFGTPPCGEFADPLPSPTTSSTALIRATLDAARAVGLQPLAGPNCHGRTGIAHATSTVRDGRRISAARAFLAPASKRTNLRVLTGALATAIRFDGTRARSVGCLHNGAWREFAADREIIVSAGTIESPKLLQLSGIGDAARLRAHGIRIVVDNPHVGRNLREHRTALLQFRLAQHAGENSDYAGARLLLNVARYLARRSGPLAAGPIDLWAFLQLAPSAVRADAQLFMMPFSLEPTSASGSSSRPEARPGMRLLGYPLRPQSQGSIEIISNDPLVPPRIDPNYLSSPDDTALSLEIVRYIRRLARAAPLARLIACETFPGPHVQRDDDIIDFVRSMGTCGYHAVGTCRMGSDQRAVVDTRLRVRGATGLRIVDCSVMPSIPSVNTNGPAMAFAWRAADLILEDAARGARPESMNCTVRPRREPSTGEC